MRNFCKIADDFAEKADFLIIYIEEAHAAGANDFATSPYNFKQHGDINDRIASAGKMIEGLGASLNMPVVVDRMDNNTMYNYGGRPERIYMIKDGVIIYQGPRGPMVDVMGLYRRHITSYFLQF